jgi:hypothetical protein
MEKREESVRRAVPMQSHEAEAFRHRGTSASADDRSPTAHGPQSAEIHQARHTSGRACEARGPRGKRSADRMAKESERAKGRTEAGDLPYLVCSRDPPAQRSRHAGAEFAPRRRCPRPRRRTWDRSPESRGGDGRRHDGQYCRRPQPQGRRCCQHARARRTCPR